MLAEKDIKLNSKVFHWPNTIKAVFELSQTRIMNRREKAEADLKVKLHNFEDKLNEYNKEVTSFRKKEVGVIFSTVKVARSEITILGC